MGRHYPLTLFAYATAENAIASPDIDAHEKWFAAAEEFLLSTLDSEASFDVITSALDQLAVPTSGIADSPAQNLAVRKEGVVAGPLGDRSFSDLFSQLRTANYSSIYAAGSFWWTMGGSDCQPFGFCCRRMPEPSLFTNMLTGRVDSADK
jgi:type VI secretion system protein ImpM